MRRAAIALLFFAALPALGAPPKWYDAYNFGVSQVRTSNFQAGAQALQRAIDEMPQENAAQAVPGQIFTYTPHFWLGIAKLNLGDPEGALREWKISEDQGAIKNTPYYAQLQDLIGHANSQRQRRAEGAATPSKQEANGAIGRALSAQMDAVTAGGDRSETYHAAQRKLAEAKDVTAKAGVDVRSYKRAADLAEEARTLFATAADEAKKQRASRLARPNPQLQRKPAPGEVVIPFDDLPQVKPAVQPPTQTQPPAQAPTQTVPLPTPQPKPDVKKAPPPEPPDTESEALVAARITVQQYRRRLVSLNLPTTDAQRLDRDLKPGIDSKAIQSVLDQVAAKERELDARKPAEVITATTPDPSHEQLEAAYRAFAAGDLAASDRVLTQLLATKESAEAYLLRGCTRYTQAMLSRNGDSLLAGATADIQSALRLNRSLRLDRAMWSPKLVAFFEQVKGR